MKDKTKNFAAGSGGQHPTEEELLCLLDGELESRQAEDVRLHLEACWTCRARSEKFRTAIISFVEYRQIVLNPALGNPANRSNFQNKLRRLVEEENAKIPLREKWLGIFHHRVSVWREKLTPRVVANSLTASLVLTSILTVYFFWFLNAPKVSAAEILERSAAVDENRVKVNFQPVVYRQIRVRKFVGKNQFDEQSFKDNAEKLELWEDFNNSRLKQTISIPGNQPSEKNRAFLAAVELMNILRANNFTPPVPLSAIAFREWHKSLPQKSEQVEEIEKADGAKMFRLTVTNLSPSEIVYGEKIIASSLTVESRDFTPIEQSFRVQTANGEATYEIRESSVAVLDLASLKPDFFTGVETVKITPKPQNSNTKSESQAAPSISISNVSVAQNNSSPTSLPVTPKEKIAVADTELELEVFNLLHTAGADKGEQIEILRQSNGQLSVNGIVETESRKNEIIAALRPIQNNPAVHLNLKTVAEAVVAEEKVQRQQKDKNSNSEIVVQMERREVDAVNFPAEEDVRAFFATRGGGSEEAVKNYASQMVSRSNQAMRHLYALKRLQSQFSAAQLANLKPEARAKWLNLIKSYARSYQNDISNLRRELQPVFGGIEGAQPPSIKTDTDILSAAERLFSAGANADNAVKSALTISDRKGGNALKSAQFWNNLAQAEALAKALQAVQ